MIHNTVSAHEGMSIFCGIGERCREGEELYREMEESGVPGQYRDGLRSDERTAGRAFPRGTLGADHGGIFPR